MDGLGFKYNDKAVRCPLYSNVVCTTNGKFIGVCCGNLRYNLGFDAMPAMRFRSLSELDDYTDVFCKDRYEQCVMYKSFAKQLDK